MAMPPDLTPATAFGPRPDFRWVAPVSLYVDATYQRDLSRRSINMMKRMYEGFAWNRIKVPNVVEVGGKLLVIDGQHTAIVAATLKVPEIPVLVVDAPGVRDQAQAFVGLNTERVKVSPFDIYRALLASGDEDAIDVDNVCKRAGVRIRALSPTCVVAEGDTSALGTIQSLVKRRGVVTARKVLEALVKARRYPISPFEIRAAERVMCHDRPGIEVDRLARAIRTSLNFNDARHRAIAAKVPIYRSMAEEWAGRLGA